MDRKRQESIDAAQLVVEINERLIPINHALNIMAQRMQRRSLSIESAHEARLIKQLQGCVRALELRLSELDPNQALPEVTLESFSINTIVQRVLNDLQDELDKKFLVVRTDIPLEDTVTADAELIRMAVYLLTRNAIQACPFDGEILITLACDHAFWDLEVADSGPGLIEGHVREGVEPPQFLERASHEFRYCVARVSQIANGHGGNISLANCAQGGTAFSISIPREPKQPEVAPSTNAKDAA